MNKTKKISINAMDKVIKENYIPSHTIDWNGLEVVIKPTLTFKDMMSFVDSVVKTCFTSDNGAYMPEAKDFAVKSNILEKYTNFTLPNNLEHRYEMIYYTDIIETVFKYTNKNQFNAMMDAINSKIENIAQANIENINKQMIELQASFEIFQNRIESMFDGINLEDIPDIMDKIASGNLDESKIVEAYMSMTAKESDD